MERARIVKQVTKEIKKIIHPMEEGPSLEIQIEIGINSIKAMLESKNWEEGLKLIAKAEEKELFKVTITMLLQVVINLTIDSQRQN